MDQKPPETITFPWQRRYEVRISRETNGFVSYEIPPGGTNLSWPDAIQRYNLLHEAGECAMLIQIDRRLIRAFGTVPDGEPEPL